MAGRQGADHDKRPSLCGQFGVPCRPHVTGGYRSLNDRVRPAIPGPASLGSEHQHRIDLRCASRRKIRSERGNCGKQQHRDADCGGVGSLHSEQ